MPPPLLMKRWVLLLANRLGKLPVSSLLHPPLPLLRALLLVHPLDQLVQGLVRGKKLQLIGSCFK